MKARMTTKGFEVVRAKVKTRSRLVNLAAQRVLFAEAAKYKQHVEKRVESFTPGAVKDLTPKYKKRKRELHGRVYPILKASGAMMRSFRVGVSKLKQRSSVLVMRAIFRGGGTAPNMMKANVHDKTRPFLTLPRGFGARVLQAIQKEVWRNNVKAV